jgi:tRNA uridine 5-carboxymethylaminomethyl modification enzyme
MPGCERAQILRYGYAVEYDMVWPHQIDATGGQDASRACSSRADQRHERLRGSRGAGARRGLNAARRALGREPVRLGATRRTSA